MRQEEKDNVLVQNESEAREWISFLKEHEDKEELKSLEDEISIDFSLNLMYRLEILI